MATEQSDAPDWPTTPAWVNYCTRDDHGLAMCWADEPYYDGQRGIWICDTEGRREIARIGAKIWRRPGGVAE